MRYGSLLAEGPPQLLCDTYQHNTLEGVFFHLCYNQQNFSKNNFQTDTHTELVSPVSKQILHTNQITKLNNNNNNSSSSNSGSSYLPDEVTPLINSPLHQNCNIPLTNNTNHINPSELQSSYIAKSYTPNLRLRCWRFITPGCPSFWNIVALFLKNFLKFIRNIGLLLFQFFLPSIQVRN